MTLFTDAGFTYTIPWLTSLCNDVQIHVERKDAAFAAADEAPPAPKPAAKPAKPAKAERSPLRRALELGPLFALATCCSFAHAPTPKPAAKPSAERKHKQRQPQPEAFVRPDAEGTFQGVC